MYVNPGDLDKQIQVIRKTEPTYNDEGKRVINEEVVRSCWAQVKNTSGTELIKAGTEFADAKMRKNAFWSGTQIQRSMPLWWSGTRVLTITFCTLIPMGTTKNIWKSGQI